MRVAIPHDLDNDTVRQRMKSRTHELADHLPAGADVHTSWPNDDRMIMTIGAMGQEVTGNVDLEPGKLVFEVQLPAMLSFLEPMISGAIEKGGQKLIAPPE
ncbi:polyhydroxyalkanoic acid system family protein [Tsuneonella mangrovi]|uniref:polyhydroxyalkanoic acid system family protein n=1 Tax=Tsuneonella mangrovi TaxID=1982042 RepID=UPI000BA1F3EE|nr:polyhydroxyalkanoic acid system family protein [Tsuneonella mangrovi]